jgi:diadenosine tetraphosphate (Ap4A) HIT family hydrolase
MKFISPFLLVWKSKYCFVFVPDRPVVKGHLLIVPKRPIENIIEVNDHDALIQLKQLLQPFGIKQFFTDA